MKRLDYNIKILELIRKCAEKNPDFRFNELLAKLGISSVDYSFKEGPVYEVDFYEESETTLGKIKTELTI